MSDVITPNPPVFQSGLVTPTHFATWTTDGVLQDSGLTVDSLGFLFLPLTGGTLLGPLTIAGTVSVLILTNLPTSDSGLVAGQVWNNGGFLAIK